MGAKNHDVLILIHRAIFPILAIAFLSCGALWGASQIDFKDRTAIENKVSDNGSIELAWEKDPTVEVILEQSTDQDFKEASQRYQGTDAGSVITGLAEGVYFFRVKEAGAEWSDPLRVEVAFFPESKLYLLLSIGGIVVLATIGTIVIGAVRTCREERGATS
ncbi:hypothetical protein NT6N_19440 [Oceaniferula spumae]|uniref:Two component regulator three Y domain-containing protein n=1 Tax=Oceaniferula spumae TaxID=2979115 RepID=A0AAT9FLU5_9BACT